MNAKDFNMLCEKYDSILSPLITNTINCNMKYYGFNETIRWKYSYNKDLSIMATSNRKTNIIELNILSLLQALKENDFLTIEYYLLHEIRHLFQHLIIDDYKNNREVEIDIEIIKKWIFEDEHYITVIDENNNVNPDYFKQDSEMDSYAFSLAVMKYKYGNIDNKLYIPEYYKSEYKEEFYSIVNDWINYFNKVFET